MGKLGAISAASTTVAAGYTELQGKYDESTTAEDARYKAQVVVVDTIKASVKTAAELADANNKIIELNQESRVAPVSVSTARCFECLMMMIY